MKYARLYLAVERGVERTGSRRGDPLHEPLVVQLLRDLATERVDKHLPRRGRVDSSRLEVEKLLGFQVRHGTAMGALDVISDNLEVGLHVDGGTGGQE